MVYSRESIKMINERNQDRYFCGGDCDYCQAETLGCNIQKEEMKKYDTMNYCKFNKCHYGEARYDVGGCGIAWSGETCYSLYPPDDKSLPRFVAYDIHLEEVKLNNE